MGANLPVSLAGNVPMIAQEFSAAKNQPSLMLVICAVGVGVAYLVVGATGFSAIALSILKGGAPLLLALYAAVNARSLDGWLLALVMLFCALGDGLITSQVAIATLMTAIAHMVATALYVRNWRSDLDAKRVLGVAAVIPLTMIAAWQLPIGIGTEDAIGTIAYAFFLSFMVAAAWWSRFAMTRVGIGVVLFLISDFMLFGIMGSLPGTDVIRGLIWIIYLTGQILITTGVVQMLRAQSTHKSWSL